LGEAIPAIMPLLGVERRCRGKDLKGGASELMRRSDVFQVGSVNEVAARCLGELCRGVEAYERNFVFA